MAKISGKLLTTLAVTGVFLAGFASAGAGHTVAKLRVGLLPHIELPTADAGPAQSEAARAGDADEQRPRYFPFLSGEDDSASISVGDTSHGYLVGGRELLETTELGILPEHKKRGLRYGSAPMMAMLADAAAALHRESGTRLWVGNLSRFGGGDIGYSVSHNSGRDSDIAFCYTDGKGQAADPPDLIALNGKGLSNTGLRFDVPRTWTVVKSLMESQHAQVQYLFVSSGLEAMLLEHARKQREPAKLLERASTLMWQPIGSAAHNDHLHLRINCTAADVQGGCINTGAVHPWTELHEGARDQRIDATVKRLSHSKPEQRKRALERLVLLRDDHHRKHIAARLDDDHPSVRQAAASALASLGGVAQVEALTERFAREPDATVRIAMVRTIGELGGGKAGAFLRETVGRPTHAATQVLSAVEAAATLRGPALLSLLPETGAALSRALLANDADDWSPLSALFRGVLMADADADLEQRIVQLAALAAAARAERLEPVPALVALLEDRDPHVRVSAAQALRVITNLSYGVRWRTAPELKQRSGRGRWAAVWQRSRGATRAAWLATGFDAAGYPVQKRLGQSRAWQLVRATAGYDHLSYNAQRVLMRIFNHHPPSLSWSKGDACRYWLKWLRARSKTYGLARPPAKTTRACRITQ